MQRVGSQLGPEFSDVLHNSIAASLSIKPPYRLINTFPVKDLPRIEGQQFQDVKFFSWQGNRFTADCDGPGLIVHRFRKFCMALLHLK